MRRRAGGKQGAAENSAGVRIVPVRCGDTPHRLAIGPGGAVALLDHQADDLAFHYTLGGRKVGCDYWRDQFRLERPQPPFPAGLGDALGEADFRRRVHRAREKEAAAAPDPLGDPFAGLPDFVRRAQTPPRARLARLARLCLEPTLEDPVDDLWLGRFPGARHGERGYGIGVPYAWWRVYYRGLAGRGLPILALERDGPEPRVLAINPAARRTGDDLVCPAVVRRDGPLWRLDWLREGGDDGEAAARP